MSRIGVKKLLNDALQRKYSVGYFESWDMESTLAVVRAAENMQSPVIIGYCGTYIAEPKRQYREDLSVYYAMLAAIAESAKVPVALLLNESDDEELVMRAIDLGFDFVMYAPVFSDHAPDPAALLEIQRRVAARAHARGACLEGEVGELPLFNSATKHTHAGEMTDAGECLEFVKLTGVDAVAVSVGNCHLKEDGKVAVDYELLDKLAAKIPVPLVLHGGTSIDESDLTKSAAHGVAKVNFGTGMKRAALNVLKEYFSSHDVDAMDPNDALGRGADLDLMVLQQQAIIKYVEDKMIALNSRGKA